MRGYVSIVKATALEMLSEPLSLLVLLAALVLTVMAPAFHYHQFGEATRMARDAGFSALFTCGSVFAVFGTIRSCRRELESGTMGMALVHPLSATGVFLAKTAGALLAAFVFAVIVSCTMLTIVNGAAIGGALAARTCDIARLWGPSFSLGLATIVAPLVLAAVLNRFGRFRFVPSAFALSLALAVSGLAYRPDLGLFLRTLPAVLALFALLAVFLSAAAAFAMRFRANAASACVGVTALVALPFIGNYYLADALSGGGTVGWATLALAVAAAAPAIAGFLLLGTHFLSEGDLT